MHRHAQLFAQSPPTGGLGFRIYFFGNRLWYLTWHGLQFPGVAPNVVPLKPQRFPPKRVKYVTVSRVVYNKFISQLKAILH